MGFNDYDKNYQFGAVLLLSFSVYGIVSFVFDIGRVIL